MKSRPYKALNSADGNLLTRFRPVVTSDEMADIMGAGQGGWCVACGYEQDGVEPDARGYTCDACSEKQVFGLEELLTSGVLIVDDDAGDKGVDGE